ncbi:MAG: bifunctional demethylmenaquinone methyltransferase/2-methoxy-6-polyprenyl-1,4-benzoquinol methylase UbiE [Myxococcales bacterium]|jgi:demethylmenaquinone methyltransferase/2-methoxy-6-polyprenyl-1,4-benzoquinol methylase|nr:bifunctional demethylmenaquinone methyltransferase/2-methoxy-6-polyprenyl-1,4-benzoquinol methylase UbiE [Myxococcales bacterium]
MSNLETPNKVGTGEGVREGSGQMFDGIAERYDLLNRIISLGIDQRWRKKTVAALQMKPGERVLDLACGTADLTMLVARTEPQAAVVGLDPSKKMLAVGERKILAAGLAGQITLLEGNAESLPFAKDSYDRVCMAFGIRNVPDREKALREMARVTRSGGRIAILELAEPKQGVIGGLARFHVHAVVPWLGSLLSGSAEYRYLQRSIAAFPSAPDFTKLMQSCGLKIVAVTPLTFGVATLYVATPAEAKES